MSQLGIHFLNGEILHLDFIWQVKRKATTFLDVSSLLKRSYLNAYGVKVVTQSDNAAYVSAFYHLNNTRIPKKYQFLSAEYRNHEQIHLSININPENHGFKRVRNKFFYVVDTLREKLLQKGFVATFSGVDGAGKSTIIENIKIALEDIERRRGEVAVKIMAGNRLGVGCRNT